MTPTAVPTILTKKKMRNKKKKKKENKKKKGKKKKKKKRANKKIKPTLFVKLKMENTCMTCQHHHGVFILLARRFSVHSKCFLGVMNT